MIERHRVLKTLALKVEGLSKVYASGTVALQDVSFDIADGCFFALLGPNGAGKSTTIGIITSLVTRTAGKVKVFDHDIDREQARVKQIIGVVPQEFNFNVFEKVGDIVRNQAGYFGLTRSEALERSAEFLKKLKLWHRRNEPSRNLSGGMKRRLMLARALVNRPRLLILDEPTAGTDVEIRYGIWEFLRELNKRGTTVILTTHYLEEVEKMCDHVAIIDKGRIIENSSLNTLLAKLRSQSFLVTVESGLDAHNVALPNGTDHYKVTKVDEHTLEINISAVEMLGDVLTQLSAAGIKIKNISNKTNRVEQLFLNITRQ